MKKTLIVLLAICLFSVVGLTIVLLNSSNNALDVSDLNTSDKKEEVITPPKEPNPTNAEIIAKNLTIDNLTPKDVATFLDLDPDKEASSPDVLARQVSRLTTISGLLQAADDHSVTVAPLFNAPESFAIVPNSSIERNNEEESWQKLVKGDRIDLIALDGQIVKLVSSGLITSADISQTLSEAISISPATIDKLLKGDTTGVQTDAVNTLKNFLSSNYGIPEDTIDTLLSGDLNVSKETIEELILNRLVGALATPDSSDTAPTTES
ncbi:MAG: hypothetical protein PHD88_06540 [Firmicutes bacterium]|nr:hypothetical protein [Bacillota bacterium]